MQFYPNNPNPWIEAAVRAALCGLPELFLLSLCKSLYWEDVLVRFPQQAKLVWQGLRADGTLAEVIGDVETPDDALAAINRMAPPHLTVANDDPRLLALVEEDGRVENKPWSRNPAFTAFRYAGGHAPQTPQGEPWVLRLLYSGEQPFVGRTATLTCPEEGNHFTQTAGMVAVHPAIHQLWNTCPAVAHTLRARAFALFGYDPDGVLAEGHHDFGFVTP